MGAVPGPAVQTNGQVNGPTNGRANGQAGSLNDEGDPESKPHENGATPISAASQAPSIGALVNDDADGVVDAAEKAEQSGERQQGSASPGGSKENTAPQDIPSEKLAFREDKRVLSQLDKMFTA